MGIGPSIMPAKPAAAEPAAPIPECLLPLASQAELERTLQSFAGTFQHELAMAVLRRLGLRSAGPESDNALVTELFAFLDVTKAPFERAFFDWYGGAASAARGSVTVDDAAVAEMSAAERAKFAQASSQATSVRRRPAVTKNGGITGGATPTRGFPAVSRSCTGYIPARVIFMQGRMHGTRFHARNAQPRCAALAFESAGFAIECAALQR